MDALNGQLREEITKLATDGSFIYYEWYVERHIKIMERLAMELCDLHAEADRELVIAMVWMHNYGLIANSGDEPEAIRDDGEMFLLELGFDESMAERILAAAEADANIQDIDPQNLPLEDKIVITAEGCARFLYSYHELRWKQGFEESIDELTRREIADATIDFNYRIILPEAQAVFEPRFNYHLERNGLLPQKFFS